LPSDTRILYVLAHGAGAGMRHPFLERLSAALAERAVATLRYQFPYMERSQRRPDPPAVAVTAVRAAVRAAGAQAPGVPLIAGGKSFGGRMTSTAQSQEPLPDHLDGVRVPMLFLQGERDEFAEPLLLRQVVRRLGERATLHLVKSGDHSFNVPKRAGRSADDVRAEVCDTFVQWADGLIR
jgi:predicted alpha/beta-hydrolase family hydrolase